MTKFTTSWLTSIFTNYRGVATDQIEIDEVFTDSRQSVRFGLFIPIEGENFDGHEFLQDAILKGAVSALWNKDKEIPSFLPTDFPLFFVEDTIEALQKLASSYRDKVNPQVIGITGSNGKTTTKDFFAKVLESKFNTWKTQGNYNNHIGLPLTILQMSPDTGMLILEMGMSHFGEIEALSKIAKPDYAVITNIGESHIEYLGSREGIAKAKSEIVEGLNKDGLLIVDGDEPLLEAVINKYKSYRIGFNNENDAVIQNVVVHNDHTVFELEGERYTIPALGKHQAKNASYAIACAKQFGISYEQIQQGLEKVELTGMRFEKIETKEGAIIINDAYNASATSMKASIEVVKEMEAKRKILVLGDILELGRYSKEMHRSIAEAITPPIDAVYTYGNDSKEIFEEINKQGVNSVITYFFDFDSREKLISALRTELTANTLLLFKASRGIRLEEIIEQLTSGVIKP